MHPPSFCAWQPVFFSSPQSPCRSAEECSAGTSATYSSKAAIENVRAALASVPGARAGGSTASSGAPSAPAGGDIALPPPSRDEMPLGRALEARETAAQTLAGPPENAPNSREIFY